MASLINITTILIVSLCSIVCARVLSGSSLAKEVARILKGHSKSHDPFSGIADIPWHNPIKPTRPPTVAPPTSHRSDLDLAFIMDSTGSMSPYINNVRDHVNKLVDEIVASSSTNLRLALIEYRDHVPQDRTFVTRKHDFTSSVSTMKTWLNKARASGGGDGPEAVAEAMYDATTLSWRSDSAKISVLISDAPPHGLVPSEDRSFPDGSPNGHDPIQLARKLARKGIAIYTVGCEPSIIPYKDFFMALAYLTGGQYIPLSVPHALTDAIIGGAKEELSLRRFDSDVQKEIGKVISSGGTVNERQIAQSVFTKLKSEGAKSTQLLRNNKPLESASAQAKAIAASTSMADVRKIFKKGTSSGTSSRRFSASDSISGMSDISSRIKSFGSSFGGRKSSAASRRRLPSKSSSGSGESFATVDKAVSLDQISRLVKQATARLAV